MLRRMVVLPEGGRHIARIVCRRCCWCAELPEVPLKGLRDPRLFRALVCSACGARDAEVSIRWECQPPRSEGAERGAANKRCKGGGHRANAKIGRLGS